MSPLAGARHAGLLGVRAVVGLVFLAAVVFHLSMDQPQRLARIKRLFRFGGKLQRQPTPRPGSDPSRRAHRSGKSRSAS